jgi:site-specific DNA recombinase
VEAIRPTKEGGIMRAAIYCRVSTEDQQNEGSSLQSQSENCLSYCKKKGYNVAYKFTEAYSGLSLQRPELDKLRQLVRTQQIDVIVIYCLDRFSRNATHGVIIRDELDKYHVSLESVTEDIDKTPLGQAITYLRGTFSQIEAEKIKERTSRGRITKTKDGYMTSGGFARLYGYDYHPKENKKPPYRTINENEAETVRKIYHWCVDDRLTIYQIVMKLRELNTPSKTGGKWRRSAVWCILTNPAFAGHTYAFTTARHMQFKADKDKWIEIPGVTPSIITDELFEAAQQQLKNNKANVRRPAEYQYLLKNHVICAECGHIYAGKTHSPTKKNNYVDTRYICNGKNAMNNPGVVCHNPSWKAKDLEALIWGKLEKAVKDPDIIENEYNRRRNEPLSIPILEDELTKIDRKLRALDLEQAEQFKLAKMGFPEETIINDNKRINSERENQKIQRSQVENRLKAAKESLANIDKVKKMLQFIRGKMDNLDFKKKRLILDALDIKVYVNHGRAEIIGSDIHLLSTEVW